MSAPARLGLFAALLVLVFAGAAAAGAVVDVDRSTEPAGEAAGHGDEMGAMAPDPVRGLAVSDAGLTLEPVEAPTAPGRAGELAFRITGKDGRVVRDFDVEHTKRMHLIVVRRDMTGFQHLHPTPARRRHAGRRPSRCPRPAPTACSPTSPWTARRGRWRPTSRSAATSGAVPLPAPARTTRPATCACTSTRARAAPGSRPSCASPSRAAASPSQVEDYLGAKGHLVALREGDLAYLHVHAEEDRLAFEATFPTPGRYRLFLQVQVDGRLHTVEFTQEVAR